MAKKKVLEAIVDFIQKPTKEIKRMKREKEFNKKLQAMKKRDELKDKQEKKRDEFFSSASVDKRRKEADKKAKELAIRLEKEFMESSYGVPRKMKNGGIAMKGFGKAFVKGRK